jgi:hypothetical protein
MAHEHLIEMLDLDAVAAAPHCDPAGASDRWPAGGAQDPDH